MSKPPANAVAARRTSHLGFASAAAPEPARAESIHGTRRNRALAGKQAMSSWEQPPQRLCDDADAQGRRVGFEQRNSPMNRASRPAGSSGARGGRAERRRNHAKQRSLDNQPARAAPMIIGQLKNESVVGAERAQSKPAGKKRSKEAKKVKGGNMCF